MTKNLLQNSPGKCKKSGCSLCKSEDLLYKNITSEKNLLLTPFSESSTTNFCQIFNFHTEKKLGPSYVLVVTILDTT